MNPNPYASPVAECGIRRKPVAFHMLTVVGGFVSLTLNLWNFMDGMGGLLTLFLLAVTPVCIYSALIRAIKNNTYNQSLMFQE